MSAPLRLFLVLALVASAGAHAAKIKPPSAILREATTSIAAVEFVEGGPGGRLVFRRIEKLGGADEVPELIDTSAPADLEKIVMPGQRYLIAYTRYRREAEEIRVSRSGAQLLMTPGLEPAFLLDTPASREIINWQPGDDSPAQRERLPQLLALLSASDPQLQNFAVAEIVLRPQLAQHLDRRTRERLRQFAATITSPVDARARLLQAAAHQPEYYGKDGWTDIARDVLAQTAITVQNVNGQASLVRFAFEVLEQRHSEAAVATIARWTRSDNAALAEMALLALRRQDPREESAALESALSISLLPAGTREFLLDHQRRQRAQPLSSGP